MIKKRFLRIRNILLAILALNWIVALAKIVYGYISRSSSITADGFHSFSDGTSNIIGIIGILMASRPADEEHPYGHKKYETFASITISILLFLIAFHLMHDSISRFIKPILPEIDIFSFIIMLVTLAVNIFVFVYERKKSKELESDILFADAEHTRSDVLVSISVVFTLFAIKAGFPMMDTMVALVISVLIAKSAVNILRASSHVLCDRIAIVSDRVRNVVMQIGGVEDCHNIRTRGRVDDICVDLHVLVDTSMHVGDAHEITERIEKKIKDTINGVADVVVHIEPIDAKHK